MIVLQSVKDYKTFYCSTNDEGRRLDRVVKKMLPDIPAGLIYSSFRKGRIRVNGSKVKQSYRTSCGDSIDVHKSIFFSMEEGPGAADSAAEAELKKITILRTDNLIFLNKPAGMLTHGEDSLADLLKGGLTGIEKSLSFTPAPLHRLDRNTSGLIAAGTSIAGATEFSRLIKERRIKKYYVGLCRGRLKDELTLKDSLYRKNNITRTSKDAAGTEALTKVYPLYSSGGFTLCLFRLDTGRTHQIRSHLSAAGYPLAGDSKYGGAVKGLRYYILHSHSLLLDSYNEVCGFREVKAALPPGAVTALNRILGIDDIHAFMNKVDYR